MPISTRPLCRPLCAPRSSSGTQSLRLDERCRDLDDLGAGRAHRVHPRGQVDRHAVKVVRRQDDAPAARPARSDRRSARAIRCRRTRRRAPARRPGSAGAPPPTPLKSPPSQVGRHVTMTGRRRPASAPATSGSLTESSRSSIRSASATASRCWRSSAVVAAVTVTQSSGLTSSESHIKKSLFNRGAEEARKTRSRGGGQAKADASSVELQYHRQAVRAHGCRRLEAVGRDGLKDVRHRNGQTIANPGDSCQKHSPIVDWIYRP